MDSICRVGMQMFAKWEDNTDAGLKYITLWALFVDDPTLLETLPQYNTHKLSPASLQYLSP